MLFLLIASDASAFEEGFYSDGPTSAKSNKRATRKNLKEVFDVAAKADRTIWLHGLDKIDIGVGLLSTLSPNQKGRSPQYFTRAELEWFLENEKHKDMLTVWLHKGSGFTDKKFVNEVKKFAQKFGYKRILILGGHFMGVHVLYDSDSEPESK